MLTLAYIALAILGCGYVAISVLLGHIADFGGEGHGDAGHADPGAAEAAHMDYGVESSGHGAVSAGAHGAAAFHFPFFSPLALATLFASIGGFGLIAKYGLEVDDGTSLLLSVPAALVTAYLVTYGAWRLVAASTGSSEIRLEDLAGAAAEVITPIPAGGVGEVAAIVGSQRFTAPAREAEGSEIPRGAQVTVLRMVGTTLLVKAGERKEGGSGNA